MSRSVYTLVLFLFLFFGHQHVCFAITKDNFYAFGDVTNLDTIDTCSDVSTEFALQKKISVGNSGCPVDSVIGVNIIGGEVHIKQNVTISAVPRIILNVLNVSVMNFDQHVLYHRTRAELDDTVSVTKLFEPFMEPFGRNHTQFVPTSYSVFTWELKQDMTNSVNLFQVIIATDGTRVLIAYMYAEDMLQYTLPANHDISMGIEVCRANWTHPNSTTSTILDDLVKGSNVNVPGVWMFMINDGELILPVLCRPGCHFVTGTCTDPNMCDCIGGWEGEFCTTPSCQRDGCDNGQCNTPFTCTCNPGWKSTDCSVAICTQGCINGVCTNPDTCTCDAGWEGADCTSPICTMSCNFGTCVAPPDDCACIDGFLGQWCDVPVCTMGCTNGKCTMPNTCICNDGWEGDDCNTPICSMSCNNGDCTMPDKCTCYGGWKGDVCDTPICTMSCNNGECTMPNTCTCNGGWQGDDCSTPICSMGCINGDCTMPDTCPCHDGWGAIDCDSPICTMSCNNGDCTMPDTCTCNAGWTGEYCSTPICTMSCNNGTCVEPNTCECIVGYTGQGCDVPICLDGCMGYCTKPEECLCHYERQTGMCDTCDVGYQGERCDTCSDGYKGDPCVKSDELSSAAIGGIVAGILAFIFLVVAIVFCICLVSFCFRL